MKKRLIAGLVLHENLIVNSYQFKLHLPVGTLRHTLERLQDWQIDEIAIFNRTHSFDAEKDFIQLMSGLVDSVVNTPLSYGGGINSKATIDRVIGHGAERVIISASEVHSAEHLRHLSENCGEQALLIHLPITNEGGVFFIGNKKMNSVKILIEEFSKRVPYSWGGEILLNSVNHDGMHKPDFDLITHVLPYFKNRCGLILGGGFSSALDISRLMAISGVNGVSIGNLLHRKELAIKTMKDDASMDVRRYVKELE